jgi:hypothetical protein
VLGSAVESSRSHRANSESQSFPRHSMAREIACAVSTRLGDLERAWRQPVGGKSTLSRFPRGAGPSFELSGRTLFIKKETDHVEI